MTESIWSTDSLMRIHVAPEDTDGAYALIEVLAPWGHVTPPHIHENDAESDGPPDIGLLEREAPFHDMTLLGTPGVLPVDLVRGVSEVRTEEER